MKKFKQQPSPVRQLGLIIKTVDKLIEEWVHHFLDQIEDENYNQSDEN